MLSVSIESPNVIKEISAHDTIILGYPIYSLKKIENSFHRQRRRFRLLYQD